VEGRLRLRARHRNEEDSAERKNRQAETQSFHRFSI
jgi:hypothetical protein